MNELYALEARRPGILRARAASSPYLFSGLLKCSLCGASITIVSGCSRKQQDVRYGCSMHYNRGRKACSNTLLIGRGCNCRRKALPVAHGESLFQNLSGGR